ncbi:hypothetical protein [Clostridium algoriphilum]|nr:hypothetical protein [Clostridium algoriphilum]
MKRLLNLMKFRNSYEAFNGDISIAETDNDELVEIVWKKDVV